ncbi:MAG: fatty acyl-AMP ligase [Acidobacteriota bacterium]
MPVETQLPETAPAETAPARVLSFPDEPAARATSRGATLTEALRQRAAEKPEARHLILPQDGAEAEILTFAGLLEEAEAIAAGLRARGVEKGQTVALMLPTGKDFFFSFAGILVAGAVPVPIYPPVRVDQLEEYAERQVTILRNAAVAALITEQQMTALARLLGPKVESLQTIATAETLATEGRSDAAQLPDPSLWPELDGQDLGLIQYTSGSTGDPKGVTLTHANLIANIHAIGEAVQVRRDDVVISWLPLYHDMGLIGCWLFALCHGLEMVCFSPLDFLRRPKRWLEAMGTYRGSLSPAPNFAYELCLRRVRDRDLADLDLSSWRMALNGAEPINPETIRRFCERFAACGFRAEAMKPVYGLAENAVAVSFPPRAEPPRIDRIERDAFQRSGRAVPADEPQDAETASETLQFVAVGRAIANHEVRLVDDDDVPVDERTEGHIQFRGPSATPGYYLNPEATAAIRTADGWTRTGDRGYLADGDLFISGRVKDLIIKAGRNIDPAEVEIAAADVEGVRRGCVAAFGVANPKTGSESLVVIAETRKTDPEEKQRMASEIKHRVRAVVKSSPDVVECVPPHCVPKTPSGKLRRAECRKRYLNGNLIPRKRPVWVQLLRLGAAASGAYALSLLWRLRSRGK